MSTATHSVSDRISRSLNRREDSPTNFSQPRSQSAMSHISASRDNNSSRSYNQGLPSYMLRSRLQSFNYGADRSETNRRYYRNRYGFNIMKFSTGIYPNNIFIEHVLNHDGEIATSSMAVNFSAIFLFNQVEIGILKSFCSVILN